MGEGTGCLIFQDKFRLPSPYLHCGLSVPLTAVPGVQSLSVLAFPKRIPLRKSVFLGSKR